MSKYNPISEERKQERKANIIKELKAMIFPTILLLIIAGFVFFIMTYQNKPVEEDPVEVRAYSGDGKELVMENEHLKFVMDPTLTTFDVTVKSSGKVWHSTPEGAADDAIAVTAEKGRLQSVLLLTYSTDAGLDTTYDTYTYSATNGIYDIEQGEDYIKVDYSLGKVAKEFTIPPIITETKLNTFLDKMGVGDREKVKQFYKKYDINNLKKGDDKETLLANYPIMETEIVWILRSGQKDSAKKNLQDTFEAAGYTYEDFLEDKALDLSEAVNENPVFNCSVIYKLEGERLVVTIPYSSIESQSQYPVTSVVALPYFGAGSIDDEGYMLIPEGGGSIMDFNNGKKAQSVYYANLYGWDMALERKDVVHSTQAHMNVFGISDTKDSFICTIDEGSAYSSIKADISGRTNNYNYIQSVYTVKPREKFDMGTGTNVDAYVYLEELPDENLVQSYTFVDSGSYVDMAKAYGDYLQERFPWMAEKLDDSSVPVAIEMVGAVDKVKQIVGIPVSRPLALTTYDEATEFVTELKESGIDNLSVKYSGWCNGGVNQKILKKAKTVGALGSKKDLKNLTATAKSIGVDLYLDGITEYEFDSNIFNGFFSYRDAAKFLSRKRAELYQYSAITYTAREGIDSYFLLHGDLIIDVMKSFVAACKKYDANVSFQDVGDDLSSDFYRKNYVSRENQLNSQVEILESAKNDGQKIMVNGGNAYALGYADYVTNMDLRGSEYTILDRCVPFYQIAIHGHKNYSGFPINVCGDEESEILYAAEYGAGLSFTFMKESAFTLQKTLYTMYYGSDFSEWEEEFRTIYDRFNAELGHVYNQEIADHVILENDVRKTVYEDGTKVYVNYGYYDRKVDGVTVPARDYLVVR